MRITTKLFALGALAALLLSSGQTELQTAEAQQLDTPVAALSNVSAQSLQYSKPRQRVSQAAIAAAAQKRAQTAEGFRRTQRIERMQAAEKAAGFSEMPSVGTVRRERLFARSQNWGPNQCYTLHTHERARCLRDFTDHLKNNPSLKVGLK